MINEKKLTPAELKKREEIAQAIEKDQPGMPMGKKMAIATATAKKVAEELHPNQKVLDVDKDGDIEADDMTDLRKGKHKKVSESEEILEFAIGTKVHHPFLGAKGGVVVKPQHNGFNHASGVRTHDGNVHVEAGGKVYKFAAHNLKKESTVSQKEVATKVIASKKMKNMNESKQANVLSFKDFSEVFEEVIMENSPFDMSRMGWMAKKGDEKPVDTKKGVGRPAGNYGAYKIDKEKRNSDVYKAELSAKVKAAKADGFEARKQFKELMNAALKKREQELFGESKQLEESKESDLVNTLRKSWSGIERIDPSNPTYKQLTKLLDSLDKDMLQKLVDAKIKFVSGMALNRINKMNLSNK